MATTTRPRQKTDSTSSVSRTRPVWREKDLVAAIDVGTTKVCVVLAGRSPSGQVDVIAYSSVPSGGVRRGTVEEVADAERAVRRSIEQVREQSGFRVQSAFVGVTGTHIAFENRRHTLDAVGQDGVIIGSDLAIPEDEGIEDDGRRRLHALRMSYVVDGKEGIRDPLGMHADKLDAETHFISGETEFIDRLTQAVENAGVTVAGMVLEPLASGLAVLTPHEMEHGALLVDIGGGTTDIVGYKRGRICYTGVIPVGGWQFTNDIAVTFGTTYEAAEAAKLEYATTRDHRAHRRGDRDANTRGRRAAGTGSRLVPAHQGESAGAGRTDQDPSQGRGPRRHVAGVPRADGGRFESAGHDVADGTPTRGQDPPGRSQLQWRGPGRAESARPRHRPWDTDVGRRGAQSRSSDIGHKRQGKDTRES